MKPSRVKFKLQASYLKLYDCNYCNKEYEREQSLELHKETKHEAVLGQVKSGRSLNYVGGLGLSQE